MYRSLTSGACLSARLNASMAPAASPSVFLTDARLSIAFTCATPALWLASMASSRRLAAPGRSPSRALATPAP